MARGSGLRFQGFFIPEGDLEWTFDSSGGPGGQHANRNATRATLALDLTATRAIPEPVKDRIIPRLGTRARHGIVTVTADDSRSQWRNRAIARGRLIDLLEEALVPERTRHETQPSRASRRRRLEAKRQHADKKRLRRPPAQED